MNFFFFFESIEQIRIPEEDINIVSIPNNLHEHFKCVVGKHLFIDKPWTKISHKKIIHNLQSYKSDSCFWQFRKKLEVNTRVLRFLKNYNFWNSHKIKNDIETLSCRLSRQGVKNDYVLIGYTPFRNADEEFIICTTDKANLYIEETRAQEERELKQKVERTICRVPGHWESKNSEQDIEEVKSVPTRDKVCVIIIYYITLLWCVLLDSLELNYNSNFCRSEYFDGYNIFADFPYRKLFLFLTTAGDRVNANFFYFIYIMSHMYPLVCV